MPKGLDTFYTKRFYETGIEFSGGEEQKLVIARAFAKGGSVMVLDEPTAAIDPLSEYHIYKSISKLRTGYTTLFISHRMSTTRFSDRILVFDQGRLIENDTHEELMNKKGLYYNIISQDFSPFLNQSI